MMMIDVPENPLEDGDLAGDPEDARLLEAELLLGLSQQRAEGAAAQVLRRHHEAPLLLAHAHRHVPLGDDAASAAA